MKEKNWKGVLIPKIEEKIEKKLKDLDLKPEVSPSRFLIIHRAKKHRYFSLCQKKVKKFVFYARLHNNLDAKEKFIREIKFLGKLKESQFRIKKLVPEIIDYGVEKEFEWFLREYIPAPPLGHSRNLTQEPFPGMIEKIVKTMLEISKIPPGYFPNLKKFQIQNYFAPGIYEDLVRKKLISKKLSEKISNFIKDNFSLLEQENKYFSHGDLNLGNILSDGKDIWIIDWELIHINNFAYDIGYLWAHLWEAKRSFRQKLIEAYINHLNNEKFQKFKILLPIVASYLSLGGIEYRKRGEKTQNLEKRRRFYLNLLKNCLDFNKLIKT